MLAHIIAFMLQKHMVTRASMLARIMTAVLPEHTVTRASMLAKIITFMSSKSGVNLMGIG